MKLASIEKIESLKPHPNADRLEIAKVLGWQTIVGKGLHQEGERIVFIPIDTLLPDTAWAAPFKKDGTEKIRLKMVKLRGEHSAGVVIPLQQFPELRELPIGENVGELLGIQKYVKELPAHLQGENAGDFPTHLAAKTDEDNGLSNPDLVRETLTHPVTITQKCDGSSCTIIVEKGEILQVCSRNLSKKETPESGFWKAARKLKLSQTSFSGVIQGELCGPGIQKNPLRLPEISFIAFQIKKEDLSYMNYQEMQGFCQVELQCPVVPLISDNLELQGPLEETLKTLQDLADKQTYAGANTPAEGIVVRPKHYPKSYESRRPLGFKILNRNYKEN